MPFQGFTGQTCAYFFSIRFDNSKSNYEENKQLYLDHVKTPLRQLHAELVPVVLDIDENICVKQSRCVSGAYNDARFSKADPLKGYMYLHFCAQTGRDTDIPGFFMDASCDGYRYGLQIYHRTTKGMKALRDAAFENQTRFSALISDTLEKHAFSLEGEDYKTDHYPDVKPEVKQWLNKKSWWIGANCPVDEAFLSSALSTKLADGFQALAGVYRFMAGALR